MGNKENKKKENRSHDPNVHIGKLLIRQNIITDSQLNRALETQRKKIEDSGKPVYLGLIIVELGFASEGEVLAAINNYYCISVTSLSDNIESLLRASRIRRIRFFRLRVPIWMQLAVAATLMILASVSLLSFIILTHQKEELYQQTVKIGMVSLNYFTNNARIPLLEDNILRLNTLINEAINVEGIMYAIIIDQKRLIRAHTDHDRIGDEYIPHTDIRNKKMSGDTAYFNYTGVSGEELINLSREIVFKEKNLGQVHVGVSVDFINRLIREKTLYIIAMTSVFVVLGIIAAVGFGIRFARPILTLCSATRQIGEGNYQYKVDLKRNDELGDLSAAFNRMSKELWMKSMMQRSFGKYVGREVLEMIMANPESHWLKGTREAATILFTDIRGFTAYSENREPEAVVENLNEYFDIVTRIVLKHEGYVDKFVGDAVLGVFGVPVKHGDHVVRALMAALDMQEVLKKTAAVNGNKLLVSVGIGIHTGVVVSGNIGSQVRMEYTVIGDTVNLGSRINNLAGPGETVISREVYDLAAHKIKAEKRPPVKIKGKTEPVTTYQLIEMKEKGIM